MDVIPNDQYILELILLVWAIGHSSSSLRKRETHKV